VRFKDRLIAGDLSGAWSVVEAALSSGMSVTDFYMRVLTPALHEIGAAWESGDIDVATEHRASGIAHRILGRIGHRLSRRGRTRGGVVVGTPVGELHGLPVAMLADLLRSGGWEVMDLGCDLPAESFVNAARDADRLTALGISVTNGDNVANVQATVRALRDAFPDTPILMGGLAVATETLALELGADHWARDGIAALQILDDITSKKPAAGRSAG
jgi:methanogenic corrinoid protein MtbC1